LRLSAKAGAAVGAPAVAPTGSSVHPVQSTDNCFPFDPSEATTFIEPVDIRTDTGAALSITSPFRFIDDLAVGAPAGTDSPSAAPAHGRARMNFETAVPAVVRVWAEIGAPNKNQDSFWVRMDDGAWINWNNLAGCVDVHDSSKSGQPTVLFNLSGGSHRIEWAYREGGALLLDNLLIREDPTGSEGPPCDD